MRFECDRCHTKYSIPDERVRGKLLKIRCKTCGHVITLGGRREPATGKSATDSSPAARARGVRGRAAAVGLPPSSITPAAHPQPAQALVPPDEDLDSDKTVVSSPGVDIESLRASLASEGPATIEAPSSPQRAELEEWYLADDYGQYGPMTFSELLARIRRRELGPNPQVWREGFEDWRDLDNVSELRPHIKHLPPPRRGRIQDESSSGQAMPPSRHEMSASDQGGPLDREEPRHRPTSPTARFFGSATLEESAPEPVGQPAALPPVEPAVPPLGTALPPVVGSKDKSQVVVLVVSLTSIAVLALVVLAIYLLTKRETSTPAQPRIASAQSQHKKPTQVSSRPANPLGHREDQQPKNGQMATQGAGADEDTDDDMIMEPVTIALSKSAGHRPVGKKGKGTDHSGSRTGSGSSSGASSFSFASPSGFGPVALPGRHTTAPTPRLSSGSSEHVPRATRKVTKPEVVAVIRRHVYRLKRCYEKAVRLHPTELRRAKMKVSIRISASGRVTSVRITPGKYRGLSLGGCIVSEIRSWRFPPSTRSYATGFPLSFVGR